MPLYNFSSVEDAADFQTTLRGKYLDSIFNVDRIKSIHHDEAEEQHLKLWASLSGDEYSISFLQHCRPDIKQRHIEIGLSYFTPQSPITHPRNARYVRMEFEIEPKPSFWRPTHASRKSSDSTGRRSSLASIKSLITDPLHRRRSSASSAGDDIEAAGMPSHPCLQELFLIKLVAASMVSGSKSSMEVPTVRVGLSALPVHPYASSMEYLDIKFSSIEGTSKLSLSVHPQVPLSLLLAIPRVALTLTRSNRVQKQISTDV
jgi:hypothetical protein